MVFFRALGAGVERPMQTHQPQQDDVSRTGKKKPA
jgi:hypothetical protein